MPKPTPKPSKPSKRGGKRAPTGKKQYKVRNWREYNQALVDRGRIEFWISAEAIAAWEERRRTGKRGKPTFFSHTAVATALTLQQVFRLPLRQTEGFLASLLTRLGATVKAPDHSTLSLRGRTLPIQIRVRAVRGEPLHLVVDSTGAKVYGEGEWKVRQHGWSKHRTWRKLHLGVDESTGDILLGEVTGNDTADSEAFAPLLSQLPETAVVDQVSADGAFDRRSCYEALHERHIAHVAIPPRQGARIWQHGNTHAERLARDENLRRIRRVGRRRWKEAIGYHRRSLAETTMFRLKTIFGDRVSARTFERQRIQLLLRCKALNWMTTLGMPKSELVVA
jgi:hypothetical protein